MNQKCTSLQNISIYLIVSFNINVNEKLMLQIGNDVIDDVKIPPKKRSREDSEGFKLRLKKELMNRDGYR